MEKKYKTYANPNKNGRPLIDCVGCGKRKENHAHSMCFKCYKQQYKRKEIICKDCGRKALHQAKGYCCSCYNRVFHHDRLLNYKSMKVFGLDIVSYMEKTKKCLSCDFDKVVELHHLDGDRKNNSGANLVPLCPNCYRLLHHGSYFKEIIANLEAIGIKVKKFRMRKINSKYGE